MEHRTKMRPHVMVRRFLTIVITDILFAARCEAQVCSLSDYQSNAITIDMNRCALTDANITELTRFTSLEKLSLEENGLTTFPNVSSSGSTLNWFSLRRNDISKIDADLLLTLVNLEYLYIDVNSLTTFPNMSASGSKLKWLYLSKNRISHISHDLLLPLINLEQLWLKGNGLTSCPNVSASGSKLKYLDLAHNPIFQISNDMLIPLSGLHYLYLYSTGLTTFPNVSSSGRTLSYLNLHGNKITHISNDVLLSLINLDRLYLSSNSLSTFPNVSASGNRLRQLSLSSNKITIIADDVLLALVTLQKLTLFGNTGLKRFPHPVYGLRNIEELDISETGISHLPPILHGNIASLNMKIRSSVDVCKCENAWLKQEAPKMTTFQYDDAECNGQVWSIMTVHDITAKCAQERKQEKMLGAHAKAMPRKLSLSPFLLHSYIHSLNKIRWTATCLDTPGCVSFYWRHLEKRVGDCVLIAPGNTITVSSVPDGSSQFWSYFALT